MTLSNFYTPNTKTTLSKVESVMSPAPTKDNPFNNMTELVFTNVYEKDMASFEYNFTVTRNTLWFEMNKQDLMTFMWRFRMTKAEIQAQLERQMSHNPEMNVIISFVD